MQKGKDLISDWFALRAMGVHTSWNDKWLSWMGDRASIGLLKLFTVEEMLAASRIPVVLESIRGAFSFRCGITQEVDSTPEFTLLLLSELEHQALDEGLKSEISKTAAYVRSATAKRCPRRHRLDKWERCDMEIGQVQYVKELVSSVFVERGMHMHISWIDKHIPWMGDRIAIGMLKMWTEGQMLDESHFAVVIETIRAAFQSPINIECEVDKTPEVTLLLLRDLARQAKNREAVGKIQETIEYVECATGSSCSAPSLAEDYR